MLYAVLGPLEVSDGERAVTVGGLKERTLLAVLLASRGTIVQADVLIDALWDGTPPRSAARTLAAYITRLRGILEPRDGDRHEPLVIRTAGSGWVLDVGPRAVDSGRFEERSRLASRALREGRYVEAAGLTQLALSEWRGRAYDGFDGVDTCSREAARLDSVMAAVREDAAEAALALGQGRDLVDELERLVADEPLRERRWALLMLALYRSGRQSDALAAYTRARQTLRTEVGVDPGPDLRRLHQDMLKQAPALRTPMLQASATALGPDCPFKGLAAYTEADAGLLLGRERLLARIASRLADSGSTCLVGASGSGKSSLLHAGVVPAIRSGVLDGSENWRIAVMTPGEKPDERLAGIGRVEFLVVDQLEELFTTCRDETQRERFAIRLAKLADGETAVALAVRADFWADCAAHSELGRVITASSVLVGPLNDDELRVVASEGARRAGLTAEEDLVNRLIADTSGQQGVLPLLSTALSRTWERREGTRLTLRGYEAIGGIEGAVAGLAEETYGELDADEQQASRVILTRLAAESTMGRLVRRKALIAELAHARNQAAESAFWRLVAARLVVVDGEGAEVAHEALFVCWPRLARLLEDDAAGRRLRSRLTPSAAEWDAGGRQDSDLYRGPRLVEALDWQAQHADDVIPVERDFLDSSARYAERERLAAEARAEREARASRRLRGLLTVTAVLLVAALTAGGLAVRSGRAARAASAIAFADQLGANALLQPRQDLVLLLAAEAAKLRPGPDTTSDLLAALLRAPRALHIAYLGHRLDSAAMSPDGRVLAVGDNEGEIRLLDPRTLRVERVLRKKNGFPVTGLVYAAGGRMLLSADQVPAGGAAVELRDVTSGQVVLSLPVPDAYLTAITPDGSAITSYSPFGAFLWRRVGTSWRRTPLGMQPVVTNFSQDGSEFVVVDPGHGAQLRSARSGAVLRQIPTQSNGPAAALSPDGHVLATCDLDGVIRLWNTATGRETRELAGLSNAPSSLEFSASGNLLLSAGGDGHAIVWNVTNGQVAADVTASQGPVFEAVFASDDRTFYTVANDGTVASWDLTGRRGFGTSAMIPDDVQAVALSSDGSRLVVGSGSGDVSVLNGASFAVLHSVNVRSAVTALAVDPAGRDAAVGTDNGGLDILDLATGEVTSRVGGLHGVGGLAWSPDGRELAAADEPRDRVDVINVATGQTTSSFRVPAAPWQVAWSSDGTLLAIGLLGGNVAIADPHRGVLRSLTVSHDPFAPSVAFTRAHVLATGGRDGTVRFWDAVSAKPLSDAIPADTGVVQQLSVSRDGKLLAAAGYDGSLVLVDADSYRRLGAALPEAAGGPPVLAAIDSRHARLMAVYSSGSLTVWRLEAAGWLARACSVPGRTLTRAEWRLYLGARPYAPAC